MRKLEKCIKLLIITLLLLTASTVTVLAQDSSGSSEPPPPEEEPASDPVLEVSASIDPSGGTVPAFSSYELSGSVTATSGSYSGSNCWYLSIDDGTPFCWLEAGSGTGSFLSGSLSVGGVDNKNYSFSLCTSEGAQCSSAVSIVVVKATPTITWSDFTIDYGDSIPSASANVSGSFSYVTANYEPGTRDITANFTPSGTSNYNIASKTVVMTVIEPAKTDQTITLGALANKTMGSAAFTVSATASSGLGVTFSSQTTSICTVSGNSVTLVAPGTCTIRASQGGDSNYNAAEPVEVSFEITKVTPTITWTPSSPITYGTALGLDQLNATADVDGT
ncbi:MAG: hypothetical protein Q8Q03_00920, partial [bacterium]|nr:hypothetical protein [bacterium]